MKLAVLTLVFALPMAAEAVSTSAAQSIATPVTWSQYFSQSFYHMSIIPLMLLTIALAWQARPSTSEELPPGFQKFQWAYLSVWSVCIAADWLQGPYVYALYSAYGFSSHEIAQLFVAGFGSSLLFGCVVGTIADRFGRKKMCLAYCVLYIISCCTKHWKIYGVLMLGRVTGGIATSILFSCFECWLVSEHCSRNKFSSGLLSYMFGLMFTSMYCVAIFAGLIAQFAADAYAFAPISEGSSMYMGGYCSPFDLSIVCLLIGMGLITVLWQENYGTDQQVDSVGMLQNIKEAGRLLTTDKNNALMCLIVACFEGSMFAFVFNWTPALASKVVPPPFGVIFALFMMACMCGASTATFLGDALKPRLRLALTFSIGIGAFIVAAIVASKPNFLSVCFATFLIFEFCCGLYFPSVGILKSEVVPEHVRSTMYNMYRVPLNAVVVCLLLSNISMIKCFTLCASLLAAALVAVVGINLAPTPKRERLQV